MFINYNNSGLLYLPADVMPPTIQEITQNKTLLVSGSRQTLPYLKMEYFTRNLPLGFTNWPNKL